MVGKLGPDAIEAIVEHTGASPTAVRQGPAYGEDAAAIDYPGGTLVVSTDPISLAADRVGTLAVHVACNDVAAAGAEPRWLTSTVFLPEGTDRLDDILVQLDETAESIDVTIVGGHTEYNDALARPLLSMTALGTAEEFVPSSGAEPGDSVVLAGGAGIEATAIIATDFADAVDVPADVLAAGEEFFDEIGVLTASRLLRYDATAMHDPTEGGVLAGCYELARASSVTLAIERDAVPIHETTRQLCEAVGVDPLRTFGSGALLATAPPDAVDELLAALDDEGILSAEIGTVESAGDAPLVLDGEPVADPPEDDLYELWAEHGSD